MEVSRSWTSQIARFGSARTGSVRLTIGLLGAIALASGALAPNSAYAATPDTAYTANVVGAPNPQPGGRWAERTATAGDLNGDGVHDLWVGVPRETVNGARVGRVYAMSGATLAGNPNHPPQVLYTIDSPEPQADNQFGFAISNIGDVNGDGVPDIAIGTDAQDVGANPQQGKAWVFSGADGHLLYALDNPFPQGSFAHRARFGSRIGRAGDINGDGVPDIIVGASGNDVPAGCSSISPLPADCRVGQGQAFIFSGNPIDHLHGASGLLRTLDLPAEDQAPAPCASGCGSFGLAVQGPGDINGDHVPDQYVDAGGETVDGNASQGRVYLFSGHDGSLIRKLDDPVPQANAFFGFQDAEPLAPGDVNHDGVPDIYTNGFTQNGPAGPDQGRSWVFSGHGGSLLYEVQDPHPIEGGQFGWSLAQTDYNKDGVPDLYIGNDPHHHIPPIDQRGETNVFDGRNGTLLKNLPLPAPYDSELGSPGNLGPNLGWTVSAPGDLNGDGEPDYVAGAPFTDVGANQDQGALMSFISQLP